MKQLHYHKWNVKLKWKQFLNEFYYKRIFLFLYYFYVGNDHDNGNLYLCKKEVFVYLFISYFFIFRFYQYINVKKALCKTFNFSKPNVFRWSNPKKTKRYLIFCCVGNDHDNESLCLCKNKLSVSVFFFYNILKFDFLVHKCKVSVL